MRLAIRLPLLSELHMIYMSVWTVAWSETDEECGEWGQCALADTVYSATCVTRPSDTRSVASKAAPASLMQSLQSVRVKSILKRCNSVGEGHVVDHLLHVLMLELFHKQSHLQPAAECTTQLLQQA